ncbi:hypothetical protein BD311DRAFT_765278 [Dichomitus squalens]|uniref:N-acetyltransferase domain-containing protein n=1 Tax=Dichomitus squalens TaxID=114155 RepID=A0A4Q9MGU5_9APHY|nr:hypothetical protein BD311DRAFT_765278 [Dichomitus squalens]
MSTQTIIRRITPEETVPLRHSVLWPDKSLDYVKLPEDDFGDHYGVFIDGVSAPAAVISVFYETFPQPENSAPNEVSPVVPALRFRKFACDPAHQGKGLGTKLLLHVFNDAQKFGAIWCDARLSSAGWYEREAIGMSRFGEIFLKEGIEYVRMKKTFIPLSNAEGDRASDPGPVS